MGEKIKDIGKIKFKEKIYKVELNEPINENGGNIHIQDKDGRIELSQRDFYDMASTILLASKQLRKIKGE